MNTLYKNIQKYWLSALPLLFILATFLLTYCQPLMWEKEDFKTYFLKIGFYLCGVISALWMFLHHTLLFKKGEYLRSLIICIGATIVFLWTYKHKITLHLDILLLLLCFIYNIIHRKWIRPDMTIISFFLLALLRLLAVFWNENRTFALENMHEDLLYYLLAVPIICLGFRIKEHECLAFITLCFKLFLFLLTLNIVAYILISRDWNLPFFSFFTLNKGYMPYYEVLRWSTFEHPSFIAWVILLVWGLGSFVWKKDKRLISSIEFFLYGVLLFCFAFIVQARVVIIGFPLTIILLIWFFIANKWEYQRRIFIEMGILLIGILSIFFLVKNTTYFSDPIREELSNKALENIYEHPIWGSGYGTQKIIAKEMGYYHIHNDFLASIIDLGIIGLLSFLFWIVSIYYKSIITKDNRLIYTLAIFLLLMNTDVLLNFHQGIYILFPFLIFIFFKDNPSSIT
ncbi:O-antigen ligase family protein [Capnocytophaga granulosa]|uniref:O-antigen ligase family protein n=1 Tax=Capnocytophaga granulosa TaxID=45242 RepID=UPI003857D516